MERSRNFGRPNYSNNRRKVVEDLNYEVALPAKWTTEQREGVKRIKMKYPDVTIGLHVHKDNQETTKLKSDDYMLFDLKGKSIISLTGLRKELQNFFKPLPEPPNVSSEQRSAPLKTEKHSSAPNSPPNDPAPSDKEDDPKILIDQRILKSPKTKYTDAQFATKSRLQTSSPLKSDNAQKRCSDSDKFQIDDPNPITDDYCHEMNIPDGYWRRMIGNYGSIIKTFNEQNDVKCYFLGRNDRLYPEGRTLRIRGRKEKVLNAIEKVKNFVETNLHNMEVSNSGAHVRILLGMWSEVIDVPNTVLSCSDFQKSLYKIKHDFHLHELRVINSDSSNTTKDGRYYQDSSNTDQRGRCVCTSYQLTGDEKNVKNAWKEMSDLVNRLMSKINNSDNGTVHKYNQEADSAKEEEEESESDSSSVGSKSESSHRSSSTAANTRAGGIRDRKNFPIRAVNTRYVKGVPRQKSIRGSTYHLNKRQPNLPSTNKNTEFRGSSNVKLRDEIPREEKIRGMERHHDDLLSENKTLREHIDKMRKNYEENTQSLERFKKRVFCVTCKARQRDTLFLPCSHIQMCSSCAVSVKTCPLISCGQAISKKSDVLFS